MSDNPTLWKIDGSQRHLDVEIGRLRAHQWHAEEDCG